MNSPTLSSEGEFSLLPSAAQPWLLLPLREHQSLIFYYRSVLARVYYGTRDGRLLALSCLSHHRIVVFLICLLHFDESFSDLLDKFHLFVDSLLRLNVIN